MRGSRIPSANRVINSVAPLNPADQSEANALNLMFLWDNMGTGEYMEDGSTFSRHLSLLQAREQTTPNMTLAVSAGVALISNSPVIFAGGNTALFVAPVTNPRIDLVTFRSTGTIHIIQGTEAVSPVAPAIPSTDIALYSVYNVVGETTIRDNDTQVAGQGYIQYDLRPFIGKGGSVVNQVIRGTQQISITGAGGGGTYSLNTATQNVTISTIAMDKSFYNITYYISVQGGDTVATQLTHAVRARITSTTNLELILSAFLLAAQVITVQVSYEVIEYQ